LPALAENAIPQSLDEFNSLYDNSVNLMRDLHRPMHERCFPSSSGKSHYCIHSTTATNPDNGRIVFVVETNYSDGSSDRSVCLSKASFSDMRRCFVSTGEVIDERLEGDTWDTAETVAESWGKR
jgi:hypothetical protein